MTDPIADMLTRIRNASAVRKYEVVLPMSKVKHEIAKILESEGWVQKVEVVKSQNAKNKTSSFDQLKIVLKYKKNGKPFITSLKRVSRPGLRQYVGKDEIPKVLNNLGISVISTSKGVMTGKEAKNQGIGGEIVCEIY